MIKVGDEVKFVGSGKYQFNSQFVVTEVSETGWYGWYHPMIGGIGAHGELYCLKDPKDWKPTGRHFPQVEELLNAIAMKEGLDD